MHRTFLGNSILIEHSNHHSHTAVLATYPITRKQGKLQDNATWKCNIFCCNLEMFYPHSYLRSHLLICTLTIPFYHRLNHPVYPHSFPAAWQEPIIGAFLKHYCGLRNVYWWRPSFVPYNILYSSFYGTFLPPSPYPQSTGSSQIYFGRYLLKLKRFAFNVQYCI